MRAAPVLRLLAAGLVLLLSGCATVRYYGQSIGGHLDLMRRRVPLAEAIADPATDAVLRQRLQRVAEIRRFAVAALGLPDNASYLSYADLERPYVLWNVFAAPEFELRAVESCFPLVGCLAYRGYYAEAEAQAYAARLRAAGHDVHVGGVAAYSTLGIFDDPVLNTMLRWSEAELAGVIFHELAHQRLYVRDDSAFNESFATAVQEEGLRRWRAAPGRAQETESGATLQRREDFLRLVAATRARLQQLYGSRLPPEDMRRAKAEVFAGMRAEHARLKQAWGGYAGYDRWFAEDLNNARLLAVATYHEWVPAFRRLLAAVDGELPRFYQAATAAGRLLPDERRRWLQGWKAAAEGGY